MQHLLVRCSIYLCIISITASKSLRKQPSFSQHYLTDNELNNGNRIQSIETETSSFYTKQPDSLLADNFNSAGKMDTNDDTGDDNNKDDDNNDDDNNNNDSDESFTSLLNDDSKCAEWCTCMASEMLYSTTWSAPYKVETFATISYYRIRTREPEDDIWMKYDEAQKKWLWSVDIDAGETPTEEEDFFSLEHTPEMDEKLEDADVPLRLQYLMRLVTYFFPNKPTQSTVPKDTKPPQFKSVRDCPTFHTEDDCNNVQTLLGLVQAPRPKCTFDGDTFGSGGDCEAIDPCLELDDQKQCEAAEDGKCVFSYSIAAFGSKCVTAPPDPAVRVISNPSEDAKLCYARNNLPSCTCHASKCSEVITEKYTSLALVLQKESREAEDQDSLLDYFQFSLDIMGMLPGFGMVADAINTGVYALREMWPDAIFSALAVIPSFGDMLGSIKVTFKGLSKIVGGVNFFNGILTYVDYTITALNTGKNALISFFKGSLSPLIKQALDDGLKSVTPQLIDISKQFQSVGSFFMACKTGGMELDNIGKDDKNDKNDKDEKDEKNDTNDTDDDKDDNDNNDDNDDNDDNDNPDNPDNKETFFLEAGPTNEEQKEKQEVEARSTGKKTTNGNSNSGTEAAKIALVKAGKAALTALLQSSSTERSGGKCVISVLEWQVELLRLGFGITQMILDAKTTIEELWKEHIDPDGLPGLIRFPLTWLGASTPVGDVILKCISKPNGVLIPEVIDGLCESSGNQATLSTTLLQVSNTDNDAWMKLNECLENAADKVLAQVKGKFDPTSVVVEVSENHCDIKEGEGDGKSGEGMQHALEVMNHANEDADHAGNVVPTKKEKKKKNKVKDLLIELFDQTLDGIAEKDSKKSRLEHGINMMMKWEDGKYNKKRSL